MKRIFVFFLVLVLALSLFAGSALAASVSGDGSMLPVAVPHGSEIRLYPAGSGQPGVYNSVSGRSGLPMMFILPYPLLEGGSFTIDSPLFQSSQPLGPDIDVLFYDSSCNNISSLGFTYGAQVSVPAGTNFISISQMLSQNFNGTVYFSLSNSSFSFYNFDYDLSSSGGADLSGISDIISSWQAGPYDVANTSTLFDLQNGSLISSSFDSADYQHAFYTLVRSSTLMSVLNNQMWYNTTYNSDGSLASSGFTFNRVNGAFPGSETVVPVRYLPEYLNQLGSELTSGLNKLQRDNVLIWDHVDHTYSAVQDLQTSLDGVDSTLSTALYAETDSSPSENWSVAQWLKGIYNSISGFFSSFWSPAETGIKEASEEAMEAVVTNDVHASAQNVNDFASMQSALTGFLPTGDIRGFNSLNDTAFYSFWSEETHKAMLPPVEETESVPSNSRFLLSASPPSSSAPVVDYGAFERNQAFYQSLLGGGSSDSR